jgi:uncharacterized protein (TIGR03067 family)
MNHQEFEQSAQRLAFKGFLLWFLWRYAGAILAVGIIAVVLIVAVFIGANLFAPPRPAAAPEAPEPIGDARGPGLAIPNGGLDGTWEPISMTLGILQTLGREFNAVTYTFQDDELLTRLDGHLVERSMVELEDGHEPDRMTLTVTAGRGRGKVIRAAFRLQGDVLTIAYALDGKDFPPDLGPAGGRVVLTLKRRVPK